MASMSVPESPRPIRKDPSEYTPEKGLKIAELFAANLSISEICEANFDWLPSPLFVRRWRKMYPAFDALMVEAGECRAELLVEENREISGEEGRQAAVSRNMMAANDRLAEALDPQTYGKGARLGETGVQGETRALVTLTDDQLLRIAAGKVIEGTAERVEGCGSTPVHPPDAGTGRALCEVSGTPTPATISLQHSVSADAVADARAEAVADAPSEDEAILAEVWGSDE
jgi:hypothetical protein